MLLTSKAFIRFKHSYIGHQLRGGTADTLTDKLYLTKKPQRKININQSKKLLSETFPNPLMSPVSDLKGVGPKLLAALNNMKIFTIIDLLLRFPVRAVDWKDYYHTVDNNLIDKLSVFLVTVVSIKTGESCTSVICNDSDGTILRLLYFYSGSSSNYIISKKFS